MNDPDQVTDADESYVFSHDDYEIVDATKRMLWKAVRCEIITARQLEVLARALQVFETLPAVAGNYDIQVEIMGPRRMFDEHEIYHWWDIEIEDGDLLVTSKGHFYRSVTGGDTFTSMVWRASPGYATEHDDYLDEIAIVDDAQPFIAEVQALDFSQGGYSLRVVENGEEICGDDDEDAEEGDSIEDETPCGMTLADVVRTLEAAGVECVWSSQKSTGLHSVDLKEATLADSAYKMFEHIPTLQSIDARNTNISDRTLVFIKHLESLEWLCLRRTAVTDEGLRYLQGLVGLQHLDLTGASIRGPGLLHLRNLESLRQLYVSGFQHRDKWLEMLRCELPHCEICLMG